MSINAKMQNREKQRVIKYPLVVLLLGNEAELVEDLSDALLYFGHLLATALLVLAADRVRGALLADRDRQVHSLHSTHTQHRDTLSLLHCCTRYRIQAINANSKVGVAVGLATVHQSNTESNTIIPRYAFMHLYTTTPCTIPITYFLPYNLHLE